MRHDPESSPTQAGSTPHRPSQRSRSRLVVESALVLVLALVVAVVLRTFVVGTYSIPTGSMEPTLQPHDRILVNKLSYHLHGIGRADIVVFATPKDEHCAGPPVPDLVKRVIGLPGETISLYGGQVYVNHKLLPEPWLPAEIQRDTDPGPLGTDYSLSSPFKVPAGHVYVMGDNRTESCDSRYWGPIPESSIVGKVDVRFWPLTRFHFM
jgi:signal peptidase I